MAGDPQLLARWRGWPKGEAGLLEAALLDPQQFTGENVVVSQSGGVMQRGGLRPLVPDVPTSAVVWHLEIIRGPGSSDDDYVWYVQQGVAGHSAVRRFKFREGSTGQMLTGQPSTTYDDGSDPDGVNDLASDETRFYATCNDGADITYFVIAAGGGVYQLHHNGTSIIDIAGMDPANPQGGGAVALFGDRLLIGSTDGVTNRIRYSEPADMSAWPTTNFVDIGRFRETIKGLYVVGQTCYVVMKEGSLYAITGTIGVNDTVRQVNVYGEQSSGIAYQLAAAPSRNNVLWLTRSGRLDGTTTTAVPRAVTSGQQVEHPELDDWLTGEQIDSSASAVFVMRLDGLDDVLFAHGDRALAYVNGGWAKLSFPTLSASSKWAHAFLGHVLVYDHAYTPSRFYSFQVTPLTVGIGGSAYFPYDSNDLTGGTPTPTDVTSFVRTQEFEHPQSKMVTARHVEVDFLRGDAAVATNEFVVSIDVVGVDDLGDNTEASTTPIAYSKPLPGGVVRATFVASFDPRVARRCAVRLADLRGVEVREVRLYGSVAVESSRA